MMCDKLQNNELSSFFYLFFPEQLGVYTRGRMRSLLRTNLDSKDTEEENQGEMD